jgi:hypothetical protein
MIARRCSSASCSISVSRFAWNLVKLAAVVTALALIGVALAGQEVRGGSMIDPHGPSRRVDRGIARQDRGGRYSL